MRFAQIDRLAATAAEQASVLSERHRERLQANLRTVILEKFLEPADAPSYRDAEKEAERHIDIYV